MKMLQLNTEGKWNHDEKLVHFLEKNMEIQILTWQEVSTRTRDRLFNTLGFHWIWEKTHNHTDGNFYWIWIFSRGGKIRNIQYHNYYGCDSDLPDDGLKTSWPTKDGDNCYKNSRFWLLSADFESGQSIVTIGTTHFPVARPAHAPNIHQTKSIEDLIAIINWFSDIIISGDFNFSRSSDESLNPSPCYTRLIEWSGLIDHLPREVKSTLDPVLFRIPNLHVVCDFIFSRGSVTTVRDLTLHDGLSDHLGLTADILVQK